VEQWLGVCLMVSVEQWLGVRLMLSNERLVMCCGAVARCASYGE